MVLTNSMAIALREIPGAEAMDVTPQPTRADNEARRLASAVAKGDDEAFEQLYDSYRDRLSRFALVLSRGDEGIAQEVVQLAMLTAAARLRPVDTERHLWNWLARVARQHLIKVWRRQQREPVLVQDSDLSEIPETAEPDRALEEGLDAALRELEEPDRSAVEWFYFDHISHKEIAERLNCTPKAVSRRLERARARLRTLLKETLSHET